MQNNISNNIFLIKEHIQKQFINKFGYNPNIDNPTTFNEKLQWLKLYYKNPLLTLCADKYKVRDYVKKIIGKKYLTNLLGVYNNENKINFNKLPNKFILKVNHGYAQNIICKNKLKLNEKNVKNQLKEWIKSGSNNYYFSYEWSYKNIKPKIICEEYLGDNLLDYKIFCFSGKPICIGVDMDRFTNHRKNFYDLNWNCLSIERFGSPKDDSFNIPKPLNLNEMLVVAKKLSSKFPFVRVDLYSIKGKTYFGEMTFYPGAGLDPFKPVEWDYKFGEMIKLPNNFKIKALTNIAYKNNKSSINFVNDERHASKKQLIIKIRNLQLNIIDKDNQIEQKENEVKNKENEIKSKDGLIANQNKALEAFGRLNNTLLGRINWAVHNPKKFLKKYFEKANWAIRNPGKFVKKTFWRIN